jgi:BirA family biotin operon repressor/biotin-[acetyl-CoA-carboxylase] ligase
MPVMTMTTKDLVLALLKGTEDFLSGEEMSRRLKVSRAAVHTAVTALRGEGYEIQSTTNRGYRLAGSPGRLNMGEILPWLPEGRAERVLFLESVESTNTYLRRESGAPGGLTVVANGQTGGRGRQGRGFYSPKDMGVYLSMLVRPEASHADTAGISACAALAVADAIEAVAGLRPGVKWVNDLLLGGKKICGILTELAVEAETGRVEHLIVGAGVNVNQSPGDFPEELRTIATSIRAFSGVTVDRGHLAGEMIHRFDALFSGWPGNKGKYLEAYRRDCVTLGREISILAGDSVRTAFAEDLGDDFSLIVRTPDGRREALRYGEVSVRGT